MRLRHLLSISATLAFAVLCGCANSDGTQVIPPVVLAMTDTAAPTYDDGEEKIYETYTQVALPLRKPAAGEIPQGKVDPYPHAPFHLASDTRTTIRFTLSNLDNDQHTIELLVNPWNEFVRYNPGVVVDDEATTPNFSGIDRFFILPPLGRVEGIITPDDMVELATDLATAMKLAETPPSADSGFAGPALYNRAFNQQNRSTVFDPVLAPYIPAVIANVVGFDLGLRSYNDAPKVAIEIVIDVEDDQGDRVIPDGDDTKKQGRPGTVLSPPAPPAAD